MQQCTLLLLALWAAPVAASTVSASSSATAWLESHKSPTDDQLKELAGANPAAYAIVNALLSKHSKSTVNLAPEERGPDVFRRMMSAPHLSAAEPRVAMPYASAELAEVSAPVVDQAHYDANAAANRDESAVSRLLSAVAAMGGSKGKKVSALMKKRTTNQATDNALMADESLFAEPPTPPPPQAFEEPQVQAAEVPLKKENSYLKGIDLSGDMPVRTAKRDEEKQSSNVDDGGDSLASFSFKDAAAQEITKPKPAPVQVEAPKPKKDNNVFLKWLGVVDKKPAPEEKPAAQPAKKENSYLDKIKFFG